jgi:hypothetical protein
MPYLNLREPKAKAALSLMQTVQGNMEGFTKRKVKELKRPVRLARHRQCWGIQPTATSWEWCMVA